VAKKRVGKFPKAFRQYAVARLKQCDNIIELAKELGVHRRLLLYVKPPETITVLIDQPENFVPTSGHFSTPLIGEKCRSCSHRRKRCSSPLRKSTNTLPSTPQSLCRKLCAKPSQRIAIPMTGWHW
jgi:hypothetical protein